MNFRVTKIYNPQMANRGRGLEELISAQNEVYAARGVANIQKISTPWKVLRQGNRIVSAFPEGKSTLDFRGTVTGGIPVSFDAKESEDECGLPLNHIQPHQVDYIRTALLLGEVSFIVCLVKPTGTIYVADGADVVRLWDLWKNNKGKRGYNLIPVEEMRRVSGMDYLAVALRGKEQL